MIRIALYAVFGIIAPVLALVLALATPAHAQRMCDQWSFTTVTTPGPPKQFIPAKDDERIFICGYVISSDQGQTLGFQMFAGTGVDCADNRTTIIPLIQLPVSSGPMVNRTPYATAEYAPRGHALCAQATGSGSLSVTVYWGQWP